MYIDSVFAGDVAMAQQLQREVEPMLLANRVDLCLWGHHHSYQRTCPVANVTCVDEGGAKAPATAHAPVHAVIGMAGFDLSRTLRNESAPYTRVAYAQWWGYSRIHANATTLTLQFVADIDGAVKDQFSLDVQHFV